VLHLQYMGIFKQPWQRNPDTLHRLLGYAGTRWGENEISDLEELSSKDRQEKSKKISRIAVEKFRATKNDDFRRSLVEIAMEVCAEWNWDMDVLLTDVFDLVDGTKQEDTSSSR